MRRAYDLQMTISMLTTKSPKSAKSGNSTISDTQTYKVVLCFADIRIIDSEFCLIDVKCSLVILLHLTSAIPHTHSNNN